MYHNKVCNEYLQQIPPPQKRAIILCFDIIYYTSRIFIPWQVYKHAAENINKCRYFWQNKQDYVLHSIQNQLPIHGKVWEKEAAKYWIMCIYEITKGSDQSFKVCGFLKKIIYNQRFWMRTDVLKPYKTCPMLPLQEEIKSISSKHNLRKYISVKKMRRIWYKEDITLQLTFKDFRQPRHTLTHKYRQQIYIVMFVLTWSQLYEKNTNTGNTWGL